MTAKLLNKTDLLALIILFGTIALPAQAQVWEKRDWRQWTKQDCEKILTDSPWAKKFTTSDVQLKPAGMRDGGTPEREVRPTIEYIAQLRSALPIRQAVIRTMQLQMNYDKMADLEKRSFDKQAEEFLNQDFSNRVVVHIIYQSNVKVLQQALDDIWRSSATNLPADTYLTGPRGNRMEMVRYIPPGPSAPEFELIFPKESKGEPLVNKSDRRFQVQLPGLSSIPETAPNGTPGSALDQNRRTTFNEKRILFEFDVQKMTYHGNLEY